MTEKFHYQTSNNETKQFERAKVEDFFQMLNLEKARTLAQKYSLEKPPANIHSSMDISNVLKDKMDWQEIMSLIKQGGFEGVNIPTDGVKTTEQAEQLKEELSQDIISFHGTIDPYFIGYRQEPNGDIIKHDFEVAKILDPDEKAPINYDLVAADLKTINTFQQGEKLSQIHEIQKQKLQEKNLESGQQIIESIVKYVAKNRPDGSKRPTVFETRQSIIAESPEITEENLKFFVDTCNKYFDDPSEWGLTLDVGHIMGALPREKGVGNVKVIKEEIEKTLQVLDKYKEQIKMIHISGTVTANTLASYELAQRENLDAEAVKGWSLHQVVDNQFIVEMVKRLREITQGRDIVEVSEVRPIHSAAKYFGNILKFNEQQSKDVHKEQIKLQAEILGYTR